jgi:hypothetical protein
MDPKQETDARRRVAAQQPVPRAACPGCLADLRSNLGQAVLGWCPQCYPGRDAILSELLRVTDPHWRMPQDVLDAEDEVLRLGMEAGLLRARAEAALRAHSEATAKLQYLRAERKVCLECHRAPAGRSRVCARCYEAWVRGHR